MRLFALCSFTAVLFVGVLPDAAIGQRALATTFSSGIGTSSGSAFAIATIVDHQPLGRTTVPDLSAELGFWFVERTIADQSAVANETNPNPPDGLPESLVLETIFPNPTSQSARIRFGLPKDGVVAITLFDALGRTVKKLAGEPQPAGWHLTDIRTDDLPAGTYFLRLDAGGWDQVRPLIVLH